MSLWKKLLVSAGIGSARVDTRLERARFLPGDLVQGVAKVTGGQLAQTVDDVYLDLVCSYYEDENSRGWFNLAHHRIIGAFELAPGELREFPFEVRLPLETPLTMGGFPVYLRTGLDIPFAKDPRDMDPIQVGPSPFQEACFGALAELGFRLFKADCERSRLHPGLPFIQEFEFRAESGAFFGRVEEVEMTFLPVGDGLKAVLGVEKRLAGPQEVEDVAWGEVLSGADVLAGMRLAIEKTLA